METCRHAQHAKGVHRTRRKCLGDLQAHQAEAWMVVLTADTLIADLTEVFKALNVYRWMLNPTKCIFGVPSGILRGNIVSRCDIEAIPEKIAVVTNMKPPTCIKDV